MIIRVIRGQNLNRFGTVIRKISQGIGYGTGDAIFDHMAVTSIDNVGRALTTAYFPTASSVTGDVAAATSPKWTTSQEFACCGVVTETDRTGIVTRHAYDSLRRRVKTNSLGVTSETAYRGRTTESHRYPEAVAATLSPTLSGTSANLVGRSVSNLAGTLQESWSPNPASATPGALVKSTTTTTYKPAAVASARSIAWGYDSLGQVTKADSSVSGFDRAYQYDGIGNPKKAANSLTLPTADNYTANALNQYTAVGTIIPTYDDDGNATAYPVPTRLTANSTLTWDAENRMKSANVNGVTTTYLYDAGSRRIAQTTGTTTTVFVYDGWNPVAEYNGSTLKKTYTWGSDISGSLQGAGGVGGLLAVIDQVAIGKPAYFPTFDGNGNVSEYLTSAGATVAHYEYDPFGRSTTSTGTLATSFAHRFSTKPVDGPTGLYYYGYRFYDPATGRWLSRDPIKEKGGNLYAFLANNTISNVDSLGLSTAATMVGGPLLGLAMMAANAFLVDCPNKYPNDEEGCKSCANLGGRWLWGDGY